MMHRNADETDYINANYIQGRNSPREYIATQGPMVGTVADFWRMIWEQEVNIIIILSDLLMKGKPKVDLYWPETINEPVQHGEIIAEIINYSPLNKYVIKIFRITKGDESRKVRHYFLPGWQDFGANLTPENVISFVRDVRMTITPTDKGPICVHCSAGVGRTGTYISLDVFKQAIDEENFDKEPDVFDFVMKMRENRSYMVQTENLTLKSCTLASNLDNLPPSCRGGHKAVNAKRTGKSVHPRWSRKRTTEQINQRLFSLAQC